MPSLLCLYRLSVERAGVLALEDACALTPARRQKKLLDPALALAYANRGREAAPSTTADASRVALESWMRSFI